MKFDRRISRRSFLSAAGVTTAALALTACGGSSSSVAASSAAGSTASSAAGTAQGGTLNIMLETEVQSLDPQVATDGTSFEVIADYTDGLMQMDADGAAVPAMAETYDISEDGKTYTFHLRDAKWSNGEAVTAADFVFGWQRAVDPATGIQYRNIAPGEQGFIWGSNAIGQDLWARIWAGARTSLTIAFFVALIEAVVGITAGVLWGYVRGLDFVFTELYNIFDNIPTAIVLILISYVATPSIWTMILGMSIKGWIEMARFIRNQILIIRDRDYNIASRCIGTPTLRIVLRNLLPYLVSVIMLRMALTIPEAIGNEVFITYIGLGLSVETPSLGNLVNDGRKVMMQAGLRYQLLYPTLILSFVTIAFYLIGNAFSDAADPKNHLQ